MPIQRRVDAAELPLERLATSTQLSEQEKIGEVSRQFEAVLLRQVLQTARKTMVQSSYCKNSTARGIYDDMVTSQLADSISRNGSFGLAQSLSPQLASQLTPPNLEVGPAAIRGNDHD